MPRPSMSLGEVAEFHGIPQEYLLLYEKEGVVVPLRVGDNRYYTPKDHVRIEIVLKGKRLGFSLREIKTLILAHLPAPPDLSQSQIEARIAHLKDEKAALQAAIDDLQAMTKSTK